jgi:hypothetical protein
MAISERRKGARVKFDRGIDVYLMAIDGTWRRSCPCRKLNLTSS